MNDTSTSTSGYGDNVISPDKLELTDAELQRASAQEQLANDPAP